MSDSDWFAPKRLGYGAGMPIAWQGWAMTLGFIAMATVAAVLLVPRHTMIFIAVLIPFSLAFTVIAAQHTRGGWKWRWGNDD